ncbi:MAG: hypothetical protein H6607_11090 [Flavobacteriales bacterium]|nr:hypothetical protein [Flavobacteriales bacterium]
MSSKIKYSVSIWLLLVLLVAGCKKDTEEFIYDDETKYSTTIRGVVLDNQNNPIMGAVASFNGKKASTDEYGVYEFANEKVGSQHNFITINKAGYFETCRTFRTDKTGVINLQTKLIQAFFNNSFVATNSSTLTAGAVTLDFPANAIVTENDNQPYSGTVLVAIAHIDPTTIDGTYQMPGDLSGLNANDQLLALNSYGMVYVEMQTPQGLKLQIKPGSTVKMTTEIPPLALGEAPSNVPMWHFDMSAGLWKQEGEATKNGTSYSAEIPHFSCWNYDAREESVVVCGRLVDENGNPITGIHLLLSAIDANWGGHGFVNADGTFCGRVTKGKVLNVKIQESTICSGGKGFEIFGQIGPFYSETKLGDIVIKLQGTSIKKLKVKAQFEDCNGNKVTNGYALINHELVWINQNGEANAIIQYCINRPSQITLYALDRGNKKYVRDSFAVTSDDIDLGLITICQDIVDFIEIKSSGLNTDTVAYDEMYASNKDTNIILSGYIFHSKTYINFSFNPGTNTSGTFPIGRTNIAIDSSQSNASTNLFFSANPIGSVTFTNNTTKKYYSGNYSVTLSTENNSRTETFTGNFKVSYK